MNGTIDMVRTICAKNFLKMRSWADASYAIHDDMKGYTGGTTSFGRGVVNTMCSKQKLNTKSSTESEIVSASDYITHMVWLSKFMEDIGYPINEKILY